MRREERVKLMVHIAYNSGWFDLLSFSPFNPRLEEFFKTVWLCDKETATVLAMETWRRKWLKADGEPLHYFPSKGGF